MTGRKQPRGQLLQERSPEVQPRAETATVSLRRVLEEPRGEGWEVWLEQGSYILSGFICQGKELGFWRFVGNLSEAFKQNGMICLEEHLALIWRLNHQAVGFLQSFRREWGWFRPEWEQWRQRDEGRLGRCSGARVQRSCERPGCQGKEKSQGHSWKEKGHSYRMREGAWAGEELIRKCLWVNSSVLVRDTRCAHSFILEASASASVSSSVKWAWR